MTEKDNNRTEELKNLGIEVIRFTNDEILTNIEAVKKIIETKCKYLIDSLSTPPAP